MPSAPASRWFEINARAPGEIEVLIFHEIRPDPAFFDQLNAHHPLKEIDLLINSMGGCAFTGVGIFNRLAGLGREGVQIRAHIEGVAGSAAAIIAMAASEITVQESAFLFVHPPSGSDERLVSEFSDAFTRILANRTGRGADEIRTLLESERWMSGREAVWERFADHVSVEGEKR